MSTLDDVLARLDKVREIRADRYMARCPAHDDRRPSLLVTTGDQVPITVHCFAGCTPEQVADAIGIPLARLSGAEMVDCIECGAVQGAYLDVEEGDTGLWYCHQCNEGGTGAQLYAARHDVSMSEAIKATQNGSLQTPDPPKPITPPDHTEAEEREIRRAYGAMHERELQAATVYIHRRDAAAQDRDRSSFRHWQAKLEAIRGHALWRELAAHHTIDKIDANHNTDPCDT